MTRLVERSDDRQVWSNVRETDCRTALSRGVADYVRDMAVQVRGRLLQLKHVEHAWAPPETMAEFPGCCVYATEPGSYDASQFSPDVVNIEGACLKLTSEFSQMVAVEVWTNTPDERVAIVGGLEDLFEPVDWMTGFRLELGHYFNARATFEKLSMTYLDDPDNTTRRLRKALVVLLGKVPQVARVPSGKYAGQVARVDLGVADL